MAVPSYTHDLNDWIADSDTTAWTELTNALSGGAPDEADTESALQGTNTVSQSMNTTGLASMLRLLASPVSLTSGQVALVWHGHGVATSLLSYASGGLRVAFCGATAGDWKSYYVGGSDVPPHPYGKWVNNAVDPTVTADASNAGGSPPSGGTNIYGIGSMCQQSVVVAKGQPHVCDIIRYGRAEARFKDGQAGNYCTFSGFAALNDAQTARWGLIQAVGGGYQWKGLMTIGYTAACAFTDSNVNIFIQDCRKVSSTFNKIEVRQTGTVLNWTNVSFTNVSPSTNASKGAFEVIDNATITLTSCQFTDMDTFIFHTGTTNAQNVNSTTFRRCGQVTGNAANFDKCIFASSTAAVSVKTGNLGLLDNCVFESDGSNHAVELTAAGSYTWTCTGTGYAAGSTGSPVTPTSTGNEMIYVSATTGTVDISVASGATIPSIRSAGATVNVSSGSVTATVKVTDNANANVANARVLVKASAGPLPYNSTVTITRSSSTATASLTAHGLLVNDKVFITGAAQTEYNGVFTVTAKTADTFSYTVTGTPTTPATGTIKATYVALAGLTDSNGEITVTRVFSADQPVAGWCRKSSASPYYQTGVIGGTIDSGVNTTLSGLLLPDG